MREREVRWCGVVREAFLIREELATTHLVVHPSLYQVVLQSTNTEGLLCASASAG